MKAKVLIVDDSLYMRTVLKNILVDEGYEVICDVGCGEDALKKADELKPDLITLDNIMPDINGIDVLKKLKQNGTKSKIVMISSVGQDTMVNEAMQAGAANYIIKPFTPERVVEIIDKVMLL